MKACEREDLLVKGDSMEGQLAAVTRQFSRSWRRDPA